MTRTHQFQSFLLMLILGFLAGPRVMQALNATNESDQPRVSSQVASPMSTEATSTSPTPIATTSPQTEEVQDKDPFATLEIEAKSVYVWDINAHRALYSKNSNKELPLASVTKMMMALVAVEVLPFDQQITIEPVDIEEEGDSGLLVGEQWSLAKLLDFTLVASSNDGASAIASVAGASLSPATTSEPYTNKKLFIEKMNDKARAIGLTHTYFLNESGLDIDSVTGGAYGTTRDMAMLFEYIFRRHPELFSATSYSKIDVKSQSNITHHIANTNQGVAAMNGLIGSKTGYTDLAGGNLVVIVDIGVDHPVVIAVLGSSRTGRFTDVDKLVSATVKTIVSSEPSSYGN